MHWSLKGAIALSVTALIICAPAVILRVEGLDNGLALSPPMGWSSWNHFHRNYNETLFYESAKAMATNGMKDVGYTYVNIDGGWWAGSDTGHVERNSSGYLQVNKEKFPNGIEKLIDYVHSLGLKWGHYTDSGVHYCNRDTPASYGYEEQDSKLFVSWGADMVKIDACGGEGLDQHAIMTKWEKLLNASGRHVLISNCHNQCTLPKNWQPWCPDVANMWRSSGDIHSSWDSVMQNLNTLVGAGEKGGPGRWNDPDFLEVGNIPVEESRSHFSLWCVTSSPLIAGNDLRTMSEDILSILTNKEAIAVNQQYAGSAGDRASVNGTMEVWAKPLPGKGNHAVVLLNRDDHANQTVTCSFSSLGLGATSTCQVRDLWAHQSLPAATGSVHRELGPHASAFLTLSNCTSPISSV